MSSVIQVRCVTYPESDGKPMGETDEHRDENIRQIEILRDYYEGQDVYVSGNILVFFEQGNPRKFVVPDTMVVKDIRPGKRRVFKIWKEGKAPDVVIETTSRKTKSKDTTLKPDLYARLGVKEYFLFDPTEDYLEPALQGYRLVGNQYARMEATDDGSLVSEELKLRLQKVDDALQFYRLDNGRRLLSPREARQAEAKARRAAEAARKAAEEKQKVAEEACKAAEEELERLRRELRSQKNAP